MNSMMKKHYEEIDILKGIAILLVVLGHAVIVYPIDLHEILWCRMIYDFARISHMPIFFLVSGYCFSYHGDYFPYIQKKCRRILIPYLVFNLLDLLPRALLSAFVNRPRGIGEGLYSIAVNGGAYWYLYSLFLIFLIFPLLLPLLKTKNQKIIACLICIALKFVPGLPGEFLIRRTIYHLLYFVSGYALKGSVTIEDVQKCILNHKKLSVLTAVCFPLIILILCPYYAIEDSQVLGIPLAYMGIISAVIIAVLIREGSIKNMLKGFGTYSLQIYLLNGFLLTAMRTLIVTVLKIHIPILIIIACFLFPLLGGYYFSRLVLDRYKITRYISGII